MLLKCVINIANKRNLGFCTFYNDKKSIKKRVFIFEDFFYPANPINDAIKPAKATEIIEGTILSFIKELFKIYHIQIY